MAEEAGQEEGGNTLGQERGEEGNEGEQPGLGDGGGRSEVEVSSHGDDECRGPPIPLNSEGSGSVLG